MKCIKWLILMLMICGIVNNVRNDDTKTKLERMNDVILQIAQGASATLALASILNCLGHSEKYWVPSAFYIGGWLCSLGLVSTNRKQSPNQTTQLAALATAITIATVYYNTGGFD